MPPSLPRRLRDTTAPGELSERLLSILDAQREGVLVYDARGRIVEVNRAAARMAGVPAERLLGTAPGDPLWPRTVDESGARVAVADMPGAVALRTGEPVERLIGFLRPDEPAPRWLRCAAWPLRLEDGTGVAVSFIDVTAERGVQERLRASDAANRRRALEHAAIGRIATSIAAGAAPGRVFADIAREVGALAGAHTGFVVEYEGARTGVVRGLWHDRHDPGMRVGTRLHLDPRSVTARMRRSGRPSREVLEADGTGLHVRIRAPIVISGAPWGHVGAAAPEPGELPPGSEDRLRRFAELVATAVAGAQARERLVEQARTDPLTGLLNHRVFQERLRAEASRALRHDRPLALVLFDLDAFKAVNDSEGHQAGDDVLKAVAAVLAGLARTTDVAARLGGDEFALLLPESDAHGGVRLAQRVRAEAARSRLLAARRLTLSAGVADRTYAADADELLRMADGALYWVKAHGRDAVRSYTPEDVPELSESERAERLARSQALGALRALARVIDLKDPSTREHSERVAETAAALAERLDWPPGDVALLREAGLLHDVGKVAVPDPVLFKPGRLTPEEFEQIKRHAPIGADIAAEALSERQVRWIRQHHERPDGAGYPDGIAGPDISEGAQLLAIADAWDVMTSRRPYKAPKPPGFALAECRRLTGRQFTPLAVGALEAVRAAQDAARSRST